ncbi:LacI family DNA-binding transcriptional regulator [Nocardioides marmoraquaticus]
MTPARPGRPTIHTVAAAAGVAASTVSRSFSNPGRVNHVTRTHVLEVAESLGYVPNPSARALGTGRTGTIALVVPDITNPYFAGVVKGAEGAAAQERLTLVIGDAQESPAHERRVVERLGAAVDGFVVTAARMPDADLLAAAGDRPLVLVNRVVPGVPGVVSDFGVGTRQIVAHLAALGHRSLAYLGGPAQSWSGAQRWTGLRRAAEEAGLGATRLGPFVPTMASGPAAADAVLSTDATAVVAHNDVLAISVLRRLADRGVHVPDDLTVVGFDDVFGADFCHPPLTTLAERTEEAGARAVEALARLTRPGAVPDPDQQLVRVLPTRLVVRGSSGPPATRDG